MHLLGFGLQISAHRDHSAQPRSSAGFGARGVVIDGLIRDRRKIEELGFSVYGRGQRQHYLRG